ncbi:hypothetical protein O9992_12920 [Vibrio lentus]|nr:hypothetical protein [Vibrio lentus]
MKTDSASAEDKARPSTADLMPPLNTQANEPLNTIATINIGDRFVAPI